MADSGDVDTALVALLEADATLLALMIHGVDFDVSKHGSTTFVLVAQLAHEDVYMFGGIAWERFLYLVKAVHKSTTGATAKTGAARIQTLLHMQTLSVTGYGLMRMARVERVRYTEVDEDTDARWQHQGGHYEVLVSPS